MLTKGWQTRWSTRYLKWGEEARGTVLTMDIESKSQLFGNFIKFTRKEQQPTFKPSVMCPLTPKSSSSESQYKDSTFDLIEIKELY